jgi:signal transduction histidine kinase
MSQRPFFASPQFPSPVSFNLSQLGGLKNMKQRMDDIGCDCIIESRPGSGTTIRLRLVIKRNSA